MPAIGLMRAAVICALVGLSIVPSSLDMAAPLHRGTPEARLDGPRIAVIDPVGCLDSAGISALRKLGKVSLYDEVRSAAQTSQSLAGVDIAIVDSYATASITAAVLERADTLKLLVLCSTGYERVDLAAATRKNIRVASVPAYSTEAVAEQTFALMFAVARHIVLGDSRVRRGQFQTDGTDRSLLGFDLTGKTLGVVGLGRIGTRVAQIGHGFGMRVLAWDRSAKALPGVTPVMLEQLLKESDVVSLHLPLTPETARILNAERLGFMKPSAILINTARGELIDEAALYETLRSRRIAGAGLDVLSQKSRSNPMLMLGNVVFSPHSAYYTRESLRKRTQTIVQTIRAFRSGNPINVVNFR